MADEVEPNGPRVPSHEPRLAIAISLLGVGPPPSGAWTRIEVLLPELARTMSEIDFTLLTDQAELPSVFTGNQNVTVIVSPQRKGLGALVSRILSIRRIGGEGQTAIVHCEAFPVPRQSKSRSCVTWHDLREFDSTSPYGKSVGARFKRFGIRRSVANADRIVAVSNWTKSAITQHLDVPEDKISVVRNPLPVPPQGINSFVRGLDLPEGRGKFALALGHLEPRKNLGVIVKAAALPAWPADHTLVVAGIDLGPGRDLQALASSLASPVLFLGSVTDQTKWELLQSASCLLLPSTIEGFGLTALEAIVSDTIVLASELSALPEVVGTPDTLLDPFSPDDWATAVGRVSSDSPWVRKTKNAQKEHSSRFSVSAGVQALSDVYRSLL